MEIKELLGKSKEMRTAVSAFADFLKENYGKEIMVTSSLLSQLYLAVDDFYWEIVGIESDFAAKALETRYYVDGVQISKSEAFRIKAQNEWLLEKAKTTGDMSELAECKFVVELR